ncbi:BQ2448_7175 [Microbotryum intermedium]|uniref:BQ2448_7175 protein n=1 Tax=Microbotryum intermedium TaxID=269621 RepID=A0A238FHG1_9BASI|nr:BQ2448_7175 [Microbotryum intermedium]
MARFVLGAWSYYHPGSRSECGSAARFLAGGGGNVIRPSAPKTATLDVCAYEQHRHGSSHRHRYV